jgi:hypothetical protein
VPREIIGSSKGFRKPCVGWNPPRGVWCHITGTDLVRHRDGQIYVLEDNLRCPSGVSYVLENRRLMKKLFAHHPRLRAGRRDLPAQLHRPTHLVPLPRADHLRRAARGTPCRDAEYTNSILSCLRSARENARSIREIISSEMWEQLNRFYLMVMEAANNLHTTADQHKFFTEVKEASHLFNGIAEATLTRNEAWHFLQLGRMLERADKTSRILDVKYFIPV